MFPFASTLAALFVCGLVGFLFRQQLEDLSTRISDLKKLLDFDVKELHRRSIIVQADMELMRDRLNAIEGRFITANEAMAKPFRADPKKVVVIPADTKPRPEDFGYVQYGSGMDDEGGWTLEGGEESYFDTIKEHERAFAGR